MRVGDVERKTPAIGRMDRTYRNRVEARPRFERAAIGRAGVHGTITSVDDQKGRGIYAVWLAYNCRLYGDNDLVATAAVARARHEFKQAIVRCHEKPQRIPAYPLCDKFLGSTELLLRDGVAAGSISRGGIAGRTVRLTCGGVCAGRLGANSRFFLRASNREDTQDG